MPPASPKGQLPYIVDEAETIADSTFIRAHIERRYGFDFEHHTPLDPFRWQYLIARRRGGEAYHRPVYPIDPEHPAILTGRRG